MKSTKFFILSIALLLELISAHAQPKKNKDPIMAQIDSQMRLMTLNEKVGQLNHLTSNYNTDIYDILLKYNDEIITACYEPFNCSVHQCTAIGRRIYMENSNRNSIVLDLAKASRAAHSDNIEMAGLNIAAIRPRWQSQYRLRQPQPANPKYFITANVSRNFVKTTTLL